MKHLLDVFRYRCADQVRDPAGNCPFGSNHRERNSATTPDRLQHRDRPGGDNVERLVDPRLRSGDERFRRVMLVNDRERWVGECAERHRWHSQNTAKWVGNVRAEDRCTPQAADRDANSTTDRIGGCFDLCQHSPPLAGRIRVDLFTWPGDRAPGPSVDLDSAAHDDRLERTTLGCGTQDRRGGVIG